jgi:hypothetical protein
MARSEASIPVIRLTPMLGVTCDKVWVAQERRRVDDENYV